MTGQVLLIIQTVGWNKRMYYIAKHHQDAVQGYMIYLIGAGGEINKPSWDREAAMDR